jgi:hypothetical protein
MGGVSHRITQEKFNHRRVGNQHHDSMLFSYRKRLSCTVQNCLFHNALLFLEELIEQHQILE